MPKGTPSFIHELPLRVNRAQLHALDKRLGVAHFSYNVALQTMLQRLDAMRADPEFEMACKAPRAEPAQRAARNERFKALREKHAFSEYDAHDVVATHMRAAKSLQPLIDSHVAQTLATRAFKACNRHALGGAGRPRFKRAGSISSVEGKGPTSPLNWKDDRVVWGSKRRDRAMVLRPIFDLADKQSVQAHALAGRVKYVRLVRRQIQGQTRYFAQLVCEGQPLQRFEAKQGVAAIDLGPSMAAVASHDSAALVSFLPQVGEGLADKRRLQRAMDRSKRANNPQCFNDNGTWRKGARLTKRTPHYECLRQLLAERERVMAETRKRAQGRLSNLVLSEHGNTVHTEKLSKKAWQKRWGRRMKATASAMFMEKVGRKAANAGGSLVEFSAARFKLSQLDHMQGDFIKKPLSLRIHVLRDGSGQVAHRDLYSAWLALFVSANGLDATRAQEAWAVAYPLLASAASNPVQAASWRPSAVTRSPKIGGAARSGKGQEYAARPAKAEKSHVTL